MGYKIHKRERKYSPIRNDGKKVCYLLLHLGVPSNTIPALSKNELEGVISAKKAGKQLGIRVWPVQIQGYNVSDGFRYFYRFLRYKRDDRRALRISEAMLCAASLAHGPFMNEYDTLTNYRVPANLVRDADIVDLEQLVQIEEDRDFEDKTLELPIITLRNAHNLDANSVDIAWRILPVLVEDEMLFRATRMLKSSQDDFYVWPGAIREVISEPDLTARTAIEQNKFENALHNAFKAIEAVLGDPPKDDRKFFAKIRSVGLSPEEEVGYINKLPLYKVIRNMNDARDKKSAHGSTPREVITAGELMEYQACAEYVVWAAIENKLGEPVY